MSKAGLNRNPEMDTIQINLSFRSERRKIQFYMYDTVRNLHTIIASYFNISPEEMIVKGWPIVPTDETAPLVYYLNNEEDELTLNVTTKINENICGTTSRRSLISIEMKCCMNFMNRLVELTDFFLQINSCKLQDAVENLRSSNGLTKNILVFYHDGSDRFDNFLIEILMSNAALLSQLRKNFYIIGWLPSCEIDQDQLLAVLSFLHLSTEILSKFESDKVLCLYPQGTVIKSLVIDWQEGLGSFSAAIEKFENLLLSNSVNETDCCESFKTKFEAQYTKDMIYTDINICSLASALEDVSLEYSRRILVLYFHNSASSFSRSFCECIQEGYLNFLYFFLLGWDIESDIYRKVILETLNKNEDLKFLTSYIENKSSVAVCLVPSKEGLIIVNIMQSQNKDDIIESLSCTKDFFSNENEEPMLVETQQSSNQSGAVEFQQLMFRQLGDRDFDCFENNEEKLLEQKVGHAFYGLPENESGYNEKQTKVIKQIMEIILTESNVFAEFENQVFLRVVYNCLVPLEDEQNTRREKFPDYDRNTDFEPIPVFLIRKCRSPEHSDQKEFCKIVVDHEGRVYESWELYLTKNHIRRCQMVVPKYGNYCGEDTLMHLESPSCDIGQRILSGVDIANTVGGIGSAGVLLAGAIPAVALAPPLAIGAVVVGATSGVYSLGRSIATLVDRGKHKQTLSFFDSNARGAYFNIVAGALGFTGVGATMAVTQLAARGVNISQGAVYAVNAIQVANIGVSGASVANSTYDIVQNWIDNKEAPSALAVLQLSTSILFFGHALYSFKNVNGVIEETQMKTLNEINDSLRSNNHRKIFNKLYKETVRSKGGDVTSGNAEVISTIRKLPNRDSVLAALKRSNKDMNKLGIKFRAEGGEIHFNGVPLDIGRMTKMEFNASISGIANKTTPPTVACIKAVKSSTFKDFRWRDISEKTVLNLFTVVVAPDDNIKTKIIKFAAQLLSDLILPKAFSDYLNQKFSSHRKIYIYLDLVQKFVDYTVGEYEKYYKDWEETNRDPFGLSAIFRHVSPNGPKRIVQIMNIVLNIYKDLTNLTQVAFRRLMSYIHDFIANFFVKEDELQQTVNARTSFQNLKNIPCSCCGGTYFSH